MTIIVTMITTTNDDDDDIQRVQNPSKVLIVRVTMTFKSPYKACKQLAEHCYTIWLSRCNDVT